jgi:hypothetical protein
MTEHDPDTIYFIWDGNGNTGSGFPYTFPIILDGYSNGSDTFPYTFPIILDGQPSASVFPAVYPIILA